MVSLPTNRVSHLEPWYYNPDVWFDLRLLELHPSTEHAAIVAEHLRLVREACEQLGPDATPESVSEAVVLPTWNCHRHMATLGLCEAPGKKPSAPRTAAQVDAGERFKTGRGGMTRGVSIAKQTEQVRAVLIAAGKPQTSAQIMAATGLGRFQVNRVFRTQPGFAWSGGCPRKFRLAKEAVTH